MSDSISIEIEEEKDSESAEQIIQVINSTSTINELDYY